MSTHRARRQAEREHIMADKNNKYKTIAEALGIKPLPADIKPQVKKTLANNTSIPAKVPARKPASAAVDIPELRPLVKKPVFNKDNTLMGPISKKFENPLPPSHNLDYGRGPGLTSEQLHKVMNAPHPTNQLWEKFVGLLPDNIIAEGWQDRLNQVLPPAGEKKNEKPKFIAPLGTNLPDPVKEPTPKPKPKPSPAPAIVQTGVIYSRPPEEDKLSGYLGALSDLLKPVSLDKIYDEVSGGKKLKGYANAFAALAARQKFNARKAEQNAIRNALLGLVKMENENKQKKLDRGLSERQLAIQEENAAIDRAYKNSSLGIEQQKLKALFDELGIKKAAASPEAVKKQNQNEILKALLPPLVNSVLGKKGLENIQGDKDNKEFVLGIVRSILRKAGLEPEEDPIESVKKVLNL